MKIYLIFTLIISLFVMGCTSQREYSNSSITNINTTSSKSPMLNGILKEDYFRIPKDCRLLFSAKNPATLIQDETNFRAYNVSDINDSETFYIIKCDLKTNKLYCTVNLNGNTPITPSQCQLITQTDIIRK